MLNLEDTSLTSSGKKNKHSQVPLTSPDAQHQSLYQQQYQVMVPDVASLNDERQHSKESAHPSNVQHPTTSSLKSKHSSVELQSLLTEHPQSRHCALQRHLSLWDLIALGVGASIGSGVFVLVGVVAREYAGPSSCISWALSGAAACLSGVCYCELSSHVPTSGGSYKYAHGTKYTALNDIVDI